MPGSVVLTPVERSTPTRVGPRTYRKQLLRKTGINYPGPDGKRQRVEFDDTYLASVAQAFNDGAMDLAPFILADASNRHTLDPERYRGELKAVEVTEDGLDGILELAPDAAELVERTGRRLGVSVRIKNNLEHVDGRKYDHAIHHVLGTLDPRMQGPTAGLSPWQPIDLAHDDPTETVLDLSGIPYQEATMPRHLSLEHLTDDDLTLLGQFAADNGIDLSVADEGDGDEGDDTGGDEGDADAEGDDDAEGDQDADADADQDADGADGITDAELDALIDAELEAMGVGGDTSLSADDDGTDDTDLSTDDEYVPDEAASLRAQLARREYISNGVPPWCVDLATPVLAMGADDTLDLASPLDGQAVDVRTIVAGLLDGLKGTVDLAREDGYGHDSNGTSAPTEATKAWLEYMQAEGLTD